MSDASFPGSVKTWVDKQDNVDDVFAGDTNGAYAEIKAIETELIQAGYKKSVRVATTQNSDLATAFANGQVVDGVTLVTDDRILLKNQTSGAENGIYTVNTSGAPTRTTDANSSAHMVAGLRVYVREGNVNAKGTWKLVTTEAITLDTTTLTFENALAAHLADSVYQLAEGTATAITLTTVTLTDGYAKTFIASADNNGAATTINTKPLYKPNTTTVPVLKLGKAYTVWYNLTSDCFFIKASATGNATTDKVVTGCVFSNDDDTDLVGTYNKVAGVGDKVMIANYIMPVGITGGYELLSQYPEVLCQVVDYSGLTIGACNPQYIAYIQNSYISSRFKIVSSFTTTVLDLANESLALPNCQSAYTFNTEFATVNTKLYFVRSGSSQYIQCYNAYNVLLASYYIPSTYTTSYNWCILPGGVVSFRYGDYIYLRKIDSTIDTTNTLILGTQQTGFSQAPANGRIIDGYLYLHLGTWKLVKIDLTTLTIVAETTDSRIVNKSFVNNNATTAPYFYIFSYSNPGKLYKVDKNTLEVLVEGALVSFQGDMFVKDVGHPTAILAAGYTSQAAYSMCVYLLDKTTLALIQAGYVDDTTSSSIPNGTYKFRGLDGAYDSTGGYFYSKGLLYNPNNSSYYAKWAIHSFCPFSTILLTM